ncbi:MAG: helix-turn-helix domain-containing protein [Planctomycetes bacterium]|nr:helix-turn-helix domain-containing protein [Planctomycetota bacterium]
MKFLTAKVVAETLGISLGTVYGVCARGQLPHVRIGADGRGTIRIRDKDLDDYIRRHTVYSAPEEQELKHLV